MDTPASGEANGPGASCFIEVVPDEIGLVRPIGIDGADGLAAHLQAKRLFDLLLR
jgi:hypothetical protein